MQETVDGRLTPGRDGAEGATGGVRSASFKQEEQPLEALGYLRAPPIAIPAAAVPVGDDKHRDLSYMATSVRLSGQIQPYSKPPNLRRRIAEHNLT